MASRTKYPNPNRDNNCSQRALVNGQNAMHSTFVTSTTVADDDEVNNTRVKNNNNHRRSKVKPSTSSSSSINDWSTLPLVTLCNIFANLSLNERLNASSVCNSWREVIYHSSLWPRKHLQVNLCAHKFVIPQSTTIGHQSISNGFHTFTLRQCPSPSRYNSCRAITSTSKHNFNQHLKCFIRKCSRFLHGLTIYFDPNSSHNVIDLIKILKHFSEDEVANYCEQTCSSYANCRNLRSLSLVPVTPLVRAATSERFICLYYGLTDTIRFLLSKCSRLQHLSLGGLHELVHSSNLYLEQINKTGHQRNVLCLHLSSIKAVLHHDIALQVDSALLANFTLLQQLSLDWDVFNTRTVKVLRQLVSLRYLTINVHHASSQQTVIEKQAWSQLALSLPNLKAYVNLLHTNSSYFATVRESLLDTDLPLEVFRAYFLEFETTQAPTLVCDLLENLASRHGNTLKSLVLVDHLEWPNQYLKTHSPNALIMFTWQCRLLQDLTVIGFELTDNDLIAIARLRGPTLRSFHFAESCIQLTHTHFDETPYCEAPECERQAFNKSVSDPLERPWKPTESYEMAECAQANYIPQITYHRTLLEHHCNYMY